MGKTIDDPITMQEVMDHKINVISRPFHDVAGSYPPNIDDIAAVLPGARGPGVIFTYGDDVYNPSGHPLPPELLAHEATHACQQERWGKDAWWAWYLADPQFRFDQELQAHKAEYLMYAATHNRHERRRMLKLIGQKLASELYGRLNKARECMNLIQEGTL